MRFNLRDIQARVAYWVTRTFGARVLYDKEERGLRLVEEAIELAQSFGVPRERLLTLVNVVYNKPVGDASQEIAGSFVTLLAAATAAGVDVETVSENELLRIENLPPEYFRERNVAKAAAGVGNYGTTDVL